MPQNKKPVHALLDETDLEILDFFKKNLNLSHTKTISYALRKTFEIDNPAGISILQYKAGLEKQREGTRIVNEIRRNLRENGITDFDEFEEKHIIPALKAVNEAL